MPVSFAIVGKKSGNNGRYRIDNLSTVPGN